jgi:hypothetical protein
MSTIKTDTLQNVAGTLSVPVSTVVSGSAKAWVNFNGTGTVAIRAAFNVSSITDNGTGGYTVNFSTAMPDANYVVVVGGRGAGGASFCTHNKEFTSPTVSTVAVACVNSGGGGVDSANVDVTIFR